MNGLDWRNLWDLALIEQERQNAHLERERIRREAGVASAGVLAPLLRTVGSALIVAGQRLAGEPAQVPVQQAHVA